MPHFSSNGPSQSNPLNARRGTYPLRYTRPANQYIDSDYTPMKRLSGRRSCNDLSDYARSHEPSYPRLREADTCPSAAPREESPFYHMDSRNHSMVNGDPRVVTAAFANINDDTSDVDKRPVLPLADSTSQSDTSDEQKLRAAQHNKKHDLPREVSAVVVGGFPTSFGESGVNEGIQSVSNERRDEEDASRVFRRAQEREEREELEDDRNAAEIPVGERGGCCMQLGHTMLRVVMLMQRELCSSICEFIIPILFVLGTVLLWVIFGTMSADAASYYNAAAPTMLSTQLTAVEATLCYNPSNNPIGPLPACDQAKIDSGELYCAYGRGVPTGLCYGAKYQWAPYALGTTVATATASIPTLDEIIMLQWLSMDDSLMSVSSDGLSSMQSGGLLYFTPDTAETRSVVAYMRANSKYFDVVYGGTFATNGDADAHVRDVTDTKPPNWGIVQVNSFATDNFDVDLRLNASALPTTEQPADQYYVGGLYRGAAEKYILSGFLTLQSMLYEHYMSDVLGLTAAQSLVTLTPFPTAAYKARSFISYGGELAPLVLVLGYLYPVSQLTKRIVLEKELRIREAMLIMGMSEVTMYLAWFLVYLGLNIISSLIMAGIMHATYLPNTDMGYMFFMLVFFSISTITLSGALAALFSKARLAALLAPLIYFVMAVPLFAMQNAGPGARTGIMILSPSALAVGISLIFDHETGGGAKASTLNDKHDDPTLLLVFVFLFIDILLYLLIMVYFDLVIPKDWGTSRNPLFFIIDPIKWCCCRGKDDEAGGEDGRAADGVFEPVEDEDKAAVRICGLRKKFSRGGKSFLAVNNLYWSLKEGDISVLLGHNGAGKSTTMNLMTGMLAADDGDCLIYGHSIITEKSRARQEIGLCPQHNILWPNLSVREHLNYYAAIKGLKGTARKNAVNRLLVAVDLEDKEYYKVRALSGGQKRKLSVAVAFVGGSRLVFLDEPTAGMDVGARRHTWALLKTMAKHRTILLSTHFMDEADLLGDTIAIMNQGRLQCSGTNMFLKSELGIGFVMTMSVIPHVNRQRIGQFTRGYVADAEAMESGAGEVSYRLPMNSRHQFPPMLTALEDEMGRLGINAYSLSATTLEEVFLRIANGEHGAEDQEETQGNDNASDASPASAVWNVELEESPCTLRWLQFRAMIIKRLWNALRDRRTQFFQIVCPVVCVLLAMLLTLVKFWNTPTIDLTSNLYDGRVEIPVANCEGIIDTTTPFSSGATTVLWAGITTGTAFDQELVNTDNTHTVLRNGGLLCNADGMTYSALFYNSSALHESPIMTANFYNARLRELEGSETPAMTLRLNPMPKTKREEAVTTAIYSLMIAIIIMIPFSFIPSTFVGWIVKERECKARHLQNVSGLNFYVYWSANFVFDIVSYLLTMFLVIAVFAIFNRQEYIGKDAIGATIVVFLLYGISGILMAYAISFAFDDHSTAQNTVMLLNFIVGFLLVLAVAALQMTDGDKTTKVGDILRWIFRIVPSYCVGESISNLASVALLQAFTSETTPWDMDVVGWPCVYMAIEVPVFLLITLFIDHPGRRQRSQRLFHNPDGAPEQLQDEDPDVVAEREAVLNDPERESDLVTVKNLRKEYASGKVAVRNITLGVKPGEVFGFLGTNGAGKTTTISILCQEFYPTSGHGSICGYDIVDESQRALRCIGYCPQFDACLDLLTVEEHLYLYAGVRGISSGTRDGVVEGLMKLCELTAYRKTKSHELSGGNRRKLSVAISLIGGPRVVFLDEPSAGMDPVARRGLWNAIQAVADNCSVVLTTHHLEEVEALAHRLAIMVDGTLHCIGDKTHLKQKYGTGYEVTVRVLNDTKANVNAVMHFFESTFPNCELAEERSGRLTYSLDKTRKLSEVFTELERAQASLGLSDYNVSQSSVEQIFLRISEEAEVKAEEEHYRELEENEKKCCSRCR